MICGMSWLAAAGCGGGSTTAPSAAGGTSAPTQGTSAPAGSAVISGLLAGTSGSGGSTEALGVSGSSPTAAGGALVAGVTVRVVGTELTAVANDAGAFTLSGVPTGNVTLKFSSSAVNATADVSNVRANELVQIQVQLSASSAVVVSDARATAVSLCHAEGNGSYHLITVDDSSESAHRAHGDGKVGDLVPGRPFMIFGEDCRPLGPAVDIEKYTNGQDADSAPGPSIGVGQPVTWEFRVTNKGTVSLTGIVVTDDKGVSVGCGGVTTLGAGASMTCTGSGVAVLGQYRNVGTVTANFTFQSTSGSVTDSDASHYLGILPQEEDEPKVTLCHKTGAGFYNKIDVSVSAEPAHRAHGDAKVGEAVPGMTGKTFTASCGVQ